MKSNILQAIRQFCIECMGGSRDEIKRCISPQCWIFPYRFGKNPCRKERVLTDEQKVARKRAGERLNILRQHKKDADINSEKPRPD